MSFKNFFTSHFNYQPEKNYQFNLSENEVSSTSSQVNYNDDSKKVNIFPSLSVNLDYMKTKYNLLINSDIVLREFTINARGKQYNAFIVYIDGMVNNEIMDNFVLKPLMLRNKSNLYEGTQSKVISEAIANNITVRKVKKFDLSSYLMECLMPQNSVKEVPDFEKAASRYKFSEIAYCL